MCSLVTCISEKTIRSSAVSSSMSVCLSKPAALEHRLLSIDLMPLSA